MKGMLRENIELRQRIVLCSPIEFQRHKNIVKVIAK
jgi:hypothetical protein